MRPAEPVTRTVFGTGAVYLDCARSVLHCLPVFPAIFRKSDGGARTVEWVLRVAVAGEFLGHGIFALQGKQAWIGWIQLFTGADAAFASQFLFLIGVMDVWVACVILLRPVRVVLLWAAAWGFWTALVRPLVGEPIWDFIERFANWGAPLALLFLRGWPQTARTWLR